MLSKILTILLRLIGIIPFPVLYFFSNILTFIVYRIFQYRKEVVRLNITNAFPHLPIKERLRIEQKSYLNFVDVLLENLKLLSISKSDLQARMRFVNPQTLQDLNDSGKGVMLIGAHYNNWEWMALSLSASIPQKMFSVYKPLNNSTIEQLMLRVRSRFGANIIPMNSFPKVVLKNKNQSTVNLMLADQSPHRSKVDYYCDFLNQDTPVYLGAEKLMKAANLELLFVEVARVKRGFYEMKIVPLASKVLGEKGATTKLHVNHLEQLIKNNPENWLWSHRRWKHSRKK